MNFYNHFIGDYARDTQDLSLVEHGAYRVLLDHYYAQHGDMPDDITKLNRVCYATTAAERRAVKAIADRYFPVNGDGRRHNRRADEEIAKAKEWGESTEARRENERERQRRHRERRQKLFADLRAIGITPKFDTTTEELERLLHAEQSRDGAVSVTGYVTRDVTANHNHSHNQRTSNSKASDAPHRKSAAAPLTPDCPHEKLIALYHELLPTCMHMVEWNAQRQALMRSRWREKAQPKGKHEGYSTEEAGLAFWRRFFAYVAQSDFLTGRAQPAQGRKVFVADLEWLIRPTNFAKVIEGKYHS